MGSPEDKIEVAILSVYSNTFLTIAKLVAGILMGSVAVISEAIHSGIDLLAAIMARYSVKKSAEPADKEHRYGHGKYENLSGMIEGSLIFVAAVIIIYEASMKFFVDFQVELLGAGMAIMALSAIVNFFVSRRLHKIARETESPALEADAYHLSTDVWTSAGVFAALALIQLTGWQLFDPIIALVVASLIVYTAFDVTKRSAEGLLDLSLPDEEIKVIEKVMNEHWSEFTNFHRLRARKTGSERQIDLHLTVPHNLSVKEGHDLVEHLEAEIKKVLPGSIIVIHIEPCKEQCEKCRLINQADSPRCNGNQRSSPR